MKPWWKSKTVWFNLLTLASAILAEVLAVVENMAAPEWVAEVLIMVVAVVNLGLRFVTHEQVTRPHLSAPGKKQ